MTVGAAADLPRFDRRSFPGPEGYAAIGTGSIGGKGSGLRAAHGAVAQAGARLRFPRLDVFVPPFVALATDTFAAWQERNRISELTSFGLSDNRLAHVCQRAELPTEIVGDLWELVHAVRGPLAVRSSSLLEDALAHPFAGVYTTKMVSNHEPEPASRFRRLAEAVRLVYASTFFRGAQEYLRAAGRDPAEERMAVVVQSVVGLKHGERFYPDVSAVARSFNFYPVGDARPEDGVVDLALGLGKTIVDGGRAWTYSPARPAAGPPFGSARELLDGTQRRFWAVRTLGPPRYDPVAEDEHMVLSDLALAEEDGALRHLASTWDPSSDRLTPGIGTHGPRALDFAPLLRWAPWPFNDAVKALLGLFEEHTGGPVEMELAMVLPERESGTARLGVVQVRPLGGSREDVRVEPEELRRPETLIAAERVMGNGLREGLTDVVFVKPEAFDLAQSRAVAQEVGRLNAALCAAGRPYVLVGFGRWGSADPWLGIPVAWAQISGARVIVEASLPSRPVDMSQGAHFFHNLLSFDVHYLSVLPTGASRVDWERLRALPRREETRFLVHAEAGSPLVVRVDGRRGRGVVRTP